MDDIEQGISICFYLLLVSKSKLMQDMVFSFLQTGLKSKIIFNNEMI